MLSDPAAEAAFGPKHSRKRRQMEVDKRRSQAAQHNVSTFWRPRGHHGMKILYRLPCAFFLMV